MAIFNFLKTPQIRRYHVDYVYYDPKKEERKEREERIRRKKEAEEKGELYVAPLRQGVFTSQLKHKQSSSCNRMKLYISVVTIAILVYMLSR